MGKKQAVRAMTVAELQELCDKRAKHVESLKKDNQRLSQLVDARIASHDAIGHQVVKILNYLGVTDYGYAVMGREVESGLDKIMEVLMPLVTTRLKALEEVSVLRKKNAALTWLAAKEFESSEHAVAFWRGCLSEFVNKTFSEKESK